jgi:hypothetical protein
MLATNLSCGMPPTSTCRISGGALVTVERVIATAASKALGDVSVYEASSGNEVWAGR